MKPVTWEHIELLATAHHFLTDDGCTPEMERRHPQHFNDVEGLDDTEKVIRLFEMWEPWGMVTVDRVVQMATISAKDLDLLLAMSAKKNEGNPSWHHRLCVGFARIEPGRVLEKKPNLAVTAFFAEAFGFNGDIATLRGFFDKIERKGNLRKADAGGLELRFISDPFSRSLPWQDVTTPVDEEVLKGVLTELGVEFTGPASQPEPEPAPLSLPSAPTAPVTEPMADSSAISDTPTKSKPRFHLACKVFRVLKTKVGERAPATVETVRNVLGVTSVTARKRLAEWEESGLLMLHRKSSSHGGKPKIVGITFHHDPETFTGKKSSEAPIAEPPAAAVAVPDKKVDLNQYDEEEKQRIVEKVFPLLHEAYHRLSDGTTLKEAVRLALVEALKTTIACLEELM